MTQLEMFKATAEHREHERFLFYASFTPDLMERILTEYKADDVEAVSNEVGMFMPKYAGMKRPDDFQEPDFSGYFENEEMSKGAFINGIGVLNIPGSIYHFTRYISPLRNAQTLEDLESFSYPNRIGWTDDHMAAQVEEIHAQNMVAVASIGHMYEDSWQIRGYEEFLMDMAMRPEWCEYILDQLKARNLAIAIAAAKAGVDFLRTGDDVANQNAMMFSPDQWRSMMKPRWAEVYDAAREIKPDIDIWYHSDGNIEEIIPDLIEIGVTILNPVQPECLSPVMVKKKYGDKIVLDGTIGTQSTMPFGTPDDVREVVKQRAEEAGQDGALILSPTHVLEPEVPIENIKAFFETAAEL